MCAHRWTAADMPTYRVVNKQEENSLSDSTWEWSKSRDREEKTRHAHQLAAAERPRSPRAPWKLHKLNRCKKTKAADVGGREEANLHRPWSPSTPAPPAIPHSPTPPHLGRLRGWLADWQATVRISNERPSPCSQSAGHLGRGGFGWGRAAWLQALIPRCYDRASGWEIWRVSSTAERPACSSTRPRIPRRAPLSSLQRLPHSRHFQSAPKTCLPASLEPPPPATSVWVNHKVVAKNRNLSLFARLYEIVMSDSKVVRGYQIGFTCAGSTSLSITMDVQW